MVMAVIGKRIKRLREQRERKQRDLAKQLGVSQATLSNWERGFSEPPYAMLVKLAEALGVSPADLLGTGEEAKAPPALDNGVVTVRLVPVVRNLWLKDLTQPENVQALAPFPGEGGTKEVIGYRLNKDTGVYLANDVLFLEIKNVYRDEEQVLTADISSGKIEVGLYSGVHAHTVIGTVIGFFRPSRD
ncbi:MAG TPA: helix-turn-helix transcriptional regulator [Firmicutes bacterium]|nr:helix-turn-helix transcriptional regulator [Candidatus Fermentithermobacillaceae bacterium]